MISIFEDRDDRAGPHIVNWEEASQENTLNGIPTSRVHKTVRGEYLLLPESCYLS